MTLFTFTIINALASAVLSLASGRGGDRRRLKNLESFATAIKCIGFALVLLFGQAFLWALSQDPQQGARAYGVWVFFWAGFQSVAYSVHAWWALFLPRSSV